MPEEIRYEDLPIIVFQSDEAYTDEIPITAWFLIRVLYEIERGHFYVAKHGNVT